MVLKNCFQHYNQLSVTTNNVLIRAVCKDENLVSQALKINLKNNGEGPDPLFFK